MERLRRVLRATVGILGSYGLACILFILLGLLTFFGTLEQAHRSLEDVRERYFDSPFFVPDAIPIPLPGAYLVLSVLFVNLVVGGILRMRRSWTRAGIYVIHGGVLVLLLSGLVEYHTSEKGYLQLFEGETGDEFLSYTEWEVVVAEAIPGGRERLHVIPHGEFDDLDIGERRRFSAPGLPFHIELSGFLKNCRPRPAADGGIDGFHLEALPPDREAQRNAAGLTATLVTPQGASEPVLLWGFQTSPHFARLGDRTFAVDLRKRRWPLPFQVTLRDFRRELHPGTESPASFESDVTRVDSGVAQDVLIHMNEPMRYRGYTLYQSGWGPQNRPGARMFSVFSVVENPADKGPLVALIIISAGLLIHFGRKLYLHIRTENARRS